MGLFGFGSKSPKEKLQKKHETNRQASDAKAAEADAVLKEMESL